MHIFLVTLPTVTYDPETEEIKVDTNNRISLKVNGLPVATSFAIFPNCERFVKQLLFFRLKKLK